jgi:glycosyltransferase involved in cell wall biosynthesis
MVKLIDLNYYTHSNISEPGKVLELQKVSFGFAKFIKEKISIQFIKHLNYEGEKYIDGIQYIFFKSRNKFWYIPFNTHRYIKIQKPDVVVIQGFIFPIQAIALRLKLGKKTKIILQHRGGKPFTGIKKLFQQIAHKFVDGYFFTSFENASEWIENKIIPDKQKCYELLGASTHFQKRDKAFCRNVLSIQSNHNFLWVGRLNTGKDPITILKAFEKYIRVYPDAKLFMIYQTNELLSEVKKLIAQNESLKNSVILKGKVSHEDLEKWYNAADFYISGSHKESTGFTLLEAMSCGCIPVITDIPSFKKITDNGKFGFLFEPGNEESLLKVLLNLKNTDREKLSVSIVEHFNQSLSFKSIADNLLQFLKN